MNIRIITYILSYNKPTTYSSKYNLIFNTYIYIYIMEIMFYYRYVCSDVYLVK